MNRLRNKLIAVFLLATLAPLGATLWVTKSLFEQSLRLAGQSQAQLDEVSRSLETTGREFYQRACASSSGRPLSQSRRSQETKRYQLPRPWRVEALP